MVVGYSPGRGLIFVVLASTRLVMRWPLCQDVCFMVVGDTSGLHFHWHCYKLVWILRKARGLCLCLFLVFVTVQWAIVSPLHRCLPYPVLNCHTITQTESYKILWFHHACFEGSLPIVDMFDLQSLCALMTKWTLDYFLCSLLQSSILITPTIRTLVGYLVDCNRLVEWLWQLLWVLSRLCLIELKVVIGDENWYTVKGLSLFVMTVASKT